MVSEGVSEGGGKVENQTESIRNKDTTVKEPNNQQKQKVGRERRYGEVRRYKEMVSVCVRRERVCVYEREKKGWEV